MKNEVFVGGWREEERIQGKQGFFLLLYLTPGPWLVRLFLVWMLVTCHQMKALFSLSAALVRCQKAIRTNPCITDPV